MTKSTIQVQNWWLFEKDVVGSFLIASILAALPISVKLTNYILVALTSYWIVRCFIAKKGTFMVSQLGSLLVNILPFFFAVITLSYCKDLKLGLHAIEKFLPLLAFPVILCTLNLSKDNQFFLNVFA